MNSHDPSAPVGIVIASHGDLARAILNSAEMIVGEQDNVVAVCLGPDDNLDSFHASLTTAIEQADGGAGVVVLIDLFGGTPGNAAALCLSQRELPIVSGVNLPMLLEVLLSRSALLPEALAAHALNSGAKGIVDITTKFKAHMQTAPPTEA
jgi:PTS system mannose-specific IIA component